MSCTAGKEVMRRSTADARFLAENIGAEGGGGGWVRLV